MPELKINISAEIGGVTKRKVITRTDAGKIEFGPTLPVAKSGTLSTRTSGTAGVITGTSHGLATNDVIDIYFTGGIAYKGVVSGVSGNDVTFASATGDALPTQGSAVTFQKHQVIDADFNGSLLIAAAVECDHRSTIIFWAGSTAVLALRQPEGEPWLYWSNGPVANGLSGQTITSITATHESTTETVEALGTILYDAN